MVKATKTARTLSARQETPRAEARRKIRARILSRVDAAENIVNAASDALGVLRDELDNVSGETSLFGELLLARTHARAAFYEKLLKSQKAPDD